MTEYIEKDAILRHLDDVQFGEKTAQMWDGVEDAMQAVIHFPAADVVPVVRCADCKWFQINIRKDGYLPNGVPECECRHWCGPCDPTDFCSYGARMDLVTDCNQVKDGDT